LSAGGDGTVRLWDAATGKAVRQIKKHYYVAAFSPDGEWLAAAKDATLIRLHGGSVGANQRDLGSHGGNGPALVFSRDGKLLASADQNGVVAVWDVTAAKQVRKLTFPPQTVVGSLSFARDGSMLAAGTRSGDGRVWEPRTGKERYKLRAAAV